MAENVWKERASHIAQRVLRIGVRPADSPDERLRKRVLVLLALCMGMGSIGDGLASWGLKDNTLSMALIGYGILTEIGLIHLWRTGARTFLQRSQFVATVLAGAAGYVYLHELPDAGVILMYGCIAPVGALLLASRREAVFWLFAFTLASGAAIAAVAVVQPLHAAGSDGIGLYLRIVGPLGLVPMIFTLLYYFVTQLEKARAHLAEQHRLLQREQHKSERLLLNILPAPIASRLKEDSLTIADGFAQVSVLFADIVGFTELSARTEPARLVEMLNEVFSTFDVLAENLGVEKIKTIGDAYMAAAGLPEPSDVHAPAIADLALQMRRAVVGVNQRLGTHLDIRIGINTGPVVAGVIGRRKFIYDLWGDAVNTASRMESHGVPGRIHVSEASYEALKGRYRFEERGSIDIKGKGTMRTYFLEEASVTA